MNTEYQTHTHNGKKLMALIDYAKTKNVTRQTVYNWIESGKVEAVNLFGRRFIKIG